MTGELITTGVTFGAGRNSINDAFSGTAEFNNIILDSGANFSGGTGGGLILSGGTDLYGIFLTTSTTFTGGTVSGATIFSSTIVVSGNTTLYSTEKVRRKTTHDYGTSGGTIMWDIDNSANAKIILSGSMTVNITNVQNGDYGTMKITQDGVGSHTLTLGTGTHKVLNGGGGAITLTATAGAVDIITFFYDGSEFDWSVGNDYT